MNLVLAEFPAGRWSWKASLQSQPWLEQCKQLPPRCLPAPWLLCLWLSQPWVIFNPPGQKPSNARLDSALPGRHQLCSRGHGRSPVPSQFPQTVLQSRIAANRLEFPLLSPKHYQSLTFHPISSSQPPLQTHSSPQQGCE